MSKAVCKSTRMFGQFDGRYRWAMYHIDSHHLVEQHMLLSMAIT